MVNDPKRPAGSRPAGPRIIPPEAFDQPQPGPRQRRFGGWLATAAVALIIIMGVRILWPGPADPEPPEEPMMTLAASDAAPDRASSESSDSADVPPERSGSLTAPDTAADRDAETAVARPETDTAVPGPDTETGVARGETDTAVAEPDTEPDAPASSEVGSDVTTGSPEPTPARMPADVRDSLDDRLARADLLLEIGRHVEAVEELMQLRDQAAQIGRTYSSDPTALAMRSRADSALAAARAACREAEAEACP